MIQSDSDLEDVEEAIEQNEWIKGFLVGHVWYVENIQFDGLQFVVHIFKSMVWTDVDLKPIQHLLATCF